MGDRIKLLITDLDNTLFDWLASFVPAFYAMITVAAKILDVDKEQLLDEMRAVHQQYHNSEKPFALLETYSVVSQYPHATPAARRDLLAEAFLEFDAVRKRHLRLYPGVRETLQSIRRAGCLIVGHTDAVPENSMHRVELLELRGELQCLYAPSSSAPYHPDPEKPRIEERYKDFLFLLPSNHRKPDPAVVKDICVRHEVAIDETLYVGDSIPRDVAMAKKAGAKAAWARYGSRHDSDLWQRLVRVTHWTEADVAREKQLQNEYGNIEPDIVIDSFSDLLTAWGFGGNSEPTSARTLAASSCGV